MPRPRHGFTLSELLVVIGVVALLVGILLPVLAYVRSAGRSAGCLSNQRELLRAGLTRAGGNGGYLPLAGLVVVPSDTAGYDSLPRALQDTGRRRYAYRPGLDAGVPMLERPGEPLEALADYVDGGGLICFDRPADTGERPSTSISTPEMIWFDFGRFTPRGYALNGHFAGFRFDDTTLRDRGRGRLVAAKDASGVLWLADAEGSDAAGQPVWVNRNRAATPPRRRACPRVARCRARRTRRPARRCHWP